VTEIASFRLQEEVATDSQIRKPPEKLQDVSIKLQVGVQRADHRRLPLIHRLGNHLKSFKMLASSYKWECSGQITGGCH
jgi:hypothetical protein